MASISLLPAKVLAAFSENSFAVRNPDNAARHSGTAAASSEAFLSATSFASALFLPASSRASLRLLSEKK
ncbi:MAG: hypothetical protein ACSHX7_08165 [Luteolibacter sp.]